MKRSASCCLTVAFLLSAAPVVAQTTPSVTVKGFVSATVYMQDQSMAFANGQAAEWAASDNDTDQWFLSGDVRNTRIQLGITGPDLPNSWRTSGVVELDFFGGFNGTGAFSDEQMTPRLRLAYVDLAKGGTTLRIGQAWTPLFGATPASVTHVAFPLAYGSAGKVGWRFPGVFLYQNLTDAEAATKLQLQLAAFRGSWAGPGDNLNSQSAGEASSIPQMEARLDVNGTAGSTGWNAYVVGHVDRKDLSGVGAEASDDELTGTAFEVGGAFRPAPLTVQGNAYWGTAIGQQFGAITQFGDIASWGAWGQVGFQFTPSWSVWGLYGMDDPDDDDVVASGNTRLLNSQIAGMIRYSVGAYSLGVEYLHASTDYALETGGEETFDANQLSFSVLFAF